MKPRIGAYVLTGDPTWLASSLSRYYHLLDDLVVLVPHDRLSWTGRPLPVDNCLEVIKNIDVDRKARLVEGQWTDCNRPLRAENAQRQEGVDQLAGMDWILQIDNDEILPTPERLFQVLAQAEKAGLDAVEWPMRVLYRHLRGQEFLAVADPTGNPQFEYPGPIAVRAGARLVDCRRPQNRSGYIRPIVRGDATSPHLAHQAPDYERRVEISATDAIIHNSWGRRPVSVWRKLLSSAHQLGVLRPLYFMFVWLPAPLTWPLLRNFHPVNRRLWPRLTREHVPSDLLQAADAAAARR